MTTDRRICFTTPVRTAEPARFPDQLSDIAEARRLVGNLRLPVVCSGHAWLDAYNRLTSAIAGGDCPGTEAASLALRFAVALERRDHREAGAPTLRAAA